jgi:predicted dehydrogenase
VPAVRFARELIDAGELGEIRHFRGRYLQDWGDTTAEVWRFEREAAGSGALGDLAAHVIDLARYLVGEIAEVGGVLDGRQDGHDAVAPGWCRLFRPPGSVALTDRTSRV